MRISAAFLLTINLLGVLSDCKAATSVDSGTRIEDERKAREQVDSDRLEVQKRLLAELRGATYKVSDGGNLTYLGSLLGTPLGQIKIDTDQKAGHFVQTLRPYLGTSERETFHFQESFSTQRKHVFHQKVNGIPVRLGELSFRINEEGFVTSVTNTTVRQGVEPDLKPRLSPDSAKEIAYTRIREMDPSFDEDGQRTSATLYYDQSEGKGRLIWDVIVLDWNPEIAPRQVLIDDSTEIAD
ncbi:MAG: hypothetical protein ACFHX7_10280 [Pseudomonadota bacterium]